MTDITELVQSLKAAADREMIYRDGAETSEIWERTVTPENILALVEALEKVQSRDVTQAAKDYHFDQQADRIAELDTELEREREKTRRVMSRIAELEESHAQVIQSRDHYKRMTEEGLKQLAEARTVKLPDLRQIVSGDRYVWSDGVYNYSQDVKVVLAAAGIKVEDE